jgi:hypothetical protein
MNEQIAQLSDEQLAQRMALLDLIEEVELSYGGAEDIEQLKERGIDEELRRRVEELHAQLAKFGYKEPSERRAGMLWLIEAMEVEDADMQPTIREEAHDLTNEQLRQRLDEELQERVQRLKSVTNQ